MTATDGYTLLPCPFCGGNEHWFNEKVSDGRLNKLGKRMKRAEISVAVTCYNCGADGPRESYWGDELQATDLLLRDQRAAAVLAWNARDASAKAITGVIQAIAEKAIRQINEQ